MSRFWSLMLATVLCVSGVCALAEEYSPMFSASMLEKLDPATRKRFAELEEENRRRWLNRNPAAREKSAAQRRSPTSQEASAAQRHHNEIEGILRRFEEKRRLDSLVKAEDIRQTQSQEKRCETVAAEIEELSTGRVFYETGPDGERRYLSDEEVETRVKSQQKSYNKFCKRSRR